MRRLPPFLDDFTRVRNDPADRRELVHFSMGQRELLRYTVVLAKRTIVLLFIV